MGIYMEQHLKFSSTYGIHLHFAYHNSVTIVLVPKVILILCLQEFHEHHCQISCGAHITMSVNTALNSLTTFEEIE